MNSEGGLTDIKDLAELTGRQYPLDASTIHTLGQLLATTGPLFIVQAFGALAILIGVILTSFVSTTFIPSTTSTSNFGFGIISGGAFTLITNQFENSLSKSDTASSSNSGSSSGSSAVATTTAAPTTTTVAQTVSTLHNYLRNDLFVSKALVHVNKGPK